MIRLASKTGRTLPSHTQNVFVPFLPIALFPRFRTLQRTVDALSVCKPLEHTHMKWSVEPPRPHLVDNICQTYVCLLGHMGIWGKCFSFCELHMWICLARRLGPLNQWVMEAMTTFDVRAPCLSTQKRCLHTCRNLVHLVHDCSISNTHTVGWITFSLSAQPTMYTCHSLCLSRRG